MNTTTIKLVDHPSNNLYRTTYSVVLIKDGREIVIGWTRNKTLSILKQCACRNAADIIRLVGGTADKTAFKRDKSKGGFTFDGCAPGWSIRFGETRRNLHGKTVEVLA